MAFRRRSRRYRGLRRRRRGSAGRRRRVRGLRIGYRM